MNPDTKTDTHEVDFDKDMLTSILGQLDLGPDLLNNAIMVPEVSEEESPASSTDEDVPKNESDDESKVEAKKQGPKLKNVSQGHSFRLRSVRIPLSNQNYKHMNVKQIADVVRTSLIQL